MDVKTALVKYGGNAMIDFKSEKRAINEIAELYRSGYQVIVVHGGGPFIESLLDKAAVETEFIYGHRKTDENTMRYVEMALSGEVNGRLVAKLNKLGVPAVGLSGKDACMVDVVKRESKVFTDKGKQKVDIGFVGDVKSVDSSLVNLLSDNGYLSVISPVSMSKNGDTYNVNADMFAGSLAACFSVDNYIVLTDINGIREDVDNPETRIPFLNLTSARELVSKIEGGMIPKLESCVAALEGGVGSAHIVKGNEKLSLKTVIESPGSLGTSLKK